MQPSGPISERPEDDDLDDDDHGLDLGRRQIVTGALAIVVIAVVLYVVLPLLPGVEKSFGRIKDGQPLWLAASFAFAFASFAGYVLMFRGVYRAGNAYATETHERIDIAASYQITMAGLAATRLLAAGGAGGLVLTAWALRQAGMDRRAVADRTVTFLVLMYAPYMLAIIVGGLGMRYGLFPGPTTWGITVLPALFGAAVIAIAVLAAAVPSDLERRIGRYGARGGRRGKIARRLANLPASASTGVRGAWAHIRRGDLVTFGAFLYWAAQVASLWAAFRAFDTSPPVAVVTLGFFIGMLGNLLPLPGGVGGVDGGMIGALAALGQGGGVAVAAVLTYRVFAFWLPTIPGVIAYLQLRRTVGRWKEERRAARAARADRDGAPARQAGLPADGFQVAPVSPTRGCEPRMSSVRRHPADASRAPARSDSADDSAEQGTATVQRLRRPASQSTNVRVMSDRIENVVIVGSGPAGYTAALYTARANLEPVVIEGFLWGGLLQQTTDVENFPGFPEGIMGPALMQNMRDQSERFGARLISDLATEIKFSDEPGGVHEVHVGTDVYLTRSIVLAMGAEHKKLGVPGEDELGGRGVSYCATCDAAFFRELPTLIVGGGDSAMEEAIFLAKFSSKVIVVNRRDEFRASKIMLDRAQETENLEFLTPFVVDEFAPGENGALEIAHLRNPQTGETKEITVKGAFIAIGHEPQSELVAEHLATDEEGYVIVEGRSSRTARHGVFAAGDLIDPSYRQAITAAGSGCTAALDAERYLRDVPLRDEEKDSVQTA